LIQFSTLRQIVFNGCVKRCAPFMIKCTGEIYRVSKQSATRLRFLRNYVLVAQLGAHLNGNLGKLGNVVGGVSVFIEYQNGNYDQAALNAGEFIIGKTQYGIVVSGAQLMYNIGMSQADQGAAQLQQTSRFYSNLAYINNKAGNYSLARKYQKEAIKYEKQAKKLYQDYLKHNK
jgi:hypothetical protein